MTDTDFAAGDVVEWDSPQVSRGNFTWAGMTCKGVIATFDDEMVVIDRFTHGGGTSILSGPWREALRKIDR